MKKIKLLAPEGTDECNVGEERYRVDNDGTVLVPEDAVEALVTTGGFTVAESKAKARAAAEIPEGMVKVYHPEKIGCSFEGVSYAPQDDGSVLVPAHAAAVLISHGFSPCAPES